MQWAIPVQHQVELPRIMKDGFFFFLEIPDINSTEPLGTKCIITLPCTLMGNGGTRHQKLLPLQVKSDRFLLAPEQFCQIS